MGRKINKQAKRNGEEVMGSGIFPLYDTDETGKKIVEFIEFLDKFIDNNMECVLTGESGGCQYDNSVGDGEGIAYMRMAIHCLERCVYISKKKDSV